MSQENWNNYITLLNVPEKHAAEINGAFDSIWETESGKALILEAYEQNKNIPVVVTNGITDYKYTDSEGTTRPVATMPRTVSHAGKGEIAIPFGLDFAFRSDDQSHPVTKERILRHELHHIAHEENDLAQRIRPHINDYILQRNGFQEDDLAKLKNMGLLNDQKIMFLKDKEGCISLEDIEEQTGHLSTAQFNEFSEHLLSSETDNIRHVLKDMQISGQQVNQLITWNNGAITMAEGHLLLERLAEGNKVTFSDVEQEFGQFPYMQLTSLATNPEFTKQLSAEQQTDLTSYTETLQPLVKVWEDEQLAHERDTVVYTDSTMDGPDKKIYGNSYIVSPAPVNP